MSKRALKIGLGLLLAVLLSTGGVYWYFFQTYHFAVVEPGVLYRAGFQDMRRFRNVYRRYPFKAVLNLQSDDDLAGKYHQLVLAEQAFCTANGILWKHIPMKQEINPTPEQIVQLLQIAGDPANQPVFMHDSQGVIREGMMAAVWQMERMGYDNQRAVQAIQWWGHPPNQTVIDFVAQYKRLDANAAGKNGQTGNNQAK